MSDTSSTRRTYTVAEAARILGISRTTAYECIRTGQLPSLRFRRRIVVPVTAVAAMIDGAWTQVPSVVEQ